MSNKLTKQQMAEQLTDDAAVQAKLIKQYNWAELDEMLTEATEKAIADSEAATEQEIAKLEEHIDKAQSEAEQFKAIEDRLMDTFNRSSDYSKSLKSVAGEQLKLVLQLMVRDFGLKAEVDDKGTTTIQPKLNCPHVEAVIKEGDQPATIYTPKNSWLLRVHADILGRKDEQGFDSRNAKKNLNTRLRELCKKHGLPKIQIKGTANSQVPGSVGGYRLEMVREDVASLHDAVVALAAKYRETHQWGDADIISDLTTALAEVSGMQVTMSRKIGNAANQ